MKQLMKLMKLMKQHILRSMVRKFLTSTYCRLVVVNSKARREMHDLLNKCLIYSQSHSCVHVAIKCYSFCLLHWKKENAVETHYMLLINNSFSTLFLKIAYSRVSYFHYTYCTCSFEQKLEFETTQRVARHQSARINAMLLITNSRWNVLSSYS